MGNLLLGCAGSQPSPEDAAGLYREALHRLSRAKDPAEALPLLDRAIALDPSRAAYRSARALALRSLGRAAEAEADYTAAIERQKADGVPPGGRAETIQGRGTLLAEAGRSAEAEADFDEVIRLVPGHIEARLHRAQVRREAGRMADAEADLHEARRLGADMADRFYNEGVRSLNLGRLEESKKFLSFALDLNPRHAEACVAQGRVALERRRFEEAVDFLTRAIELRPKDPELRHHRGNAHLALQRHSEAFEDYVQAIALKDGHAASYAMRGIVYYHYLHDLTRAERDFTRAIELDPRSHVALLNRGILRHEQGHLEEAERDIFRALALHATPEGFQRLGRVLHDKGDHERAAEVYRQALGACTDETLRLSIREDLERTLQARQGR